jgi:hypothetical protein
MASVIVIKANQQNAMQTKEMLKFKTKTKTKTKTKNIRRYIFILFLKI